MQFGYFSSFLNNTSCILIVCEESYWTNSKQVLEAVNEQFYSFHLSPSEAFRCFLVYTVFMHYDDIPISSRIRTQNNLILNIDWQFSSLQTLFYLKRTCLFTCRKSKIKRPLPELIDTVNGFTTCGLLNSSLNKLALTKSLIVFTTNSVWSKADLLVFKIIFSGSFTK